MKKHKNISYIDAHNKAVSIYKKTASALLWTGIFNIVGAIFYLVGTNGSVKELSGTFLCYGLNTFVFSLSSVREFLINSLPWSGILYIFSSFLLSAFFATVGIFAMKGKKICLFLGIGAYFIDWVFLLLCYYIKLVVIESSITYLMLGVHLVISVFLIISVIEYYKVIDIEKIRNKEVNADGRK